MLSLLCSRHNGRLCMQVTKQRSTPLVVHACTSTTNPQTLFGVVVSRIQVCSHSCHFSPATNERQPSGPWLPIGRHSDMRSIDAQCSQAACAQVLDGEPAADALGLWGTIPAWTRPRRP